MIMSKPDGTEYGENELPEDTSELTPQNDDEERQVDGYIEDQAFNN